MSDNVATMGMAGAPHRQADAAGGQDAVEARSRADLLADHDVLLVRAPNAGPLTLSGTNSWVLARNPAWVLDPGPLIEEHLARLGEAIESRGGLGGVVLTHDHHDHSDAARALLARFPAPLAASRGAVDILLHDGGTVGPFVAVATPGHSSDHYALVGAGACFTGDAVLGSGSVFISPDRGAMAAYLLALDRLRARDDFSVLCPGHGAPVWDARGKLEEYLAHRIDRENRLIAALGEGRRTVRELLDGAWPEIPTQLRPAATATLAAHLDKLDGEQALPEDVERPSFEGSEW